MAEKSLGEVRIRTEFNPSSNSEVDAVKHSAAQCINFLEEKRDSNPSERNRLISLAQTAYEEAAMWAVKALTA